MWRNSVVCVWFASCRLTGLSCAAYDDKSPDRRVCSSPPSLPSRSSSGCDEEGQARGFTASNAACFICWNRSCWTARSRLVRRCVAWHAASPHSPPTVLAPRIITSTTHHRCIWATLYWCNWAASASQTRQRAREHPAPHRPREDSVDHPADTLPQQQQQWRAGR